MKLFNLFFLSIYLSFVLRVAFPLIEYGVNYNYIAEELCEQKDNLANECHGKCYLASQFKKQVNPDENNQAKIANTDFIKIPHIVNSKAIEESYKPIINKIDNFNLHYSNTHAKPITPPPELT